MKKLSLASPVEAQRYWLGSCGALVLVAIIELSGLWQPLRGVISQGLRPFSYAGSSVVQVIRWPYEVVMNSIHSYDRIKNLELRYAEVVAQLGELEALKKENQALRDLLSTPSVTGPQENNQSQQHQAIATILGYGQPLIERHDHSVIVPGSMVLIANTLIGRVGEVTESQAQVVLLSQTRNSSVLAQTESGIAGILGGDGRSVYLTEVPIEAEVKVGERVVTVGQPGVEPGIAVGMVTAIQRPANAPTQKLTLDQHVSFYESRVVQVRR